MKLKPEKIQAWTGDSSPSCAYGLSYIHLYWSSSTTLGARGFFSLEAAEMSGEGETRSGEKQILRNHKNDQLLDGLMAQLVEDCISIAQVKT